MMPSNQAIFIVFEGLDGSGKTACARRTAELLNAIYIRTPSGALRDHVTNIIEGFEACQEAAQLLYLASVAHASQQATKALRAGNSVVLDRYLLSTEIYAAFRGSTLNLGDSLHALLRPADITVFLDAPLGTRVQRIKARDSEIGAADAESLEESADRQLRQGYLLGLAQPFAGHVLTLDSSRLGINEIASKVVCAADMLKREQA